MLQRGVTVEVTVEEVTVLQAGAQQWGSSRSESCQEHFLRSLVKHFAVAFRGQKSFCGRL